jgi:hypothetical protein
VVRDLVDDVIVVDDTAIVDAMKMCYEILKVAVEPSGAIGLAAALSDEFKQSSAWHESSKIGIIVSGGNVDLGTLWQSMYKHWLERVGPMILPLNFKRDSFRQVVCKLGIVRCKHHLLPVFLSMGYSVAATSITETEGWGSSFSFQMFFKSIPLFPSKYCLALNKYNSFVTEDYEFVKDIKIALVFQCKVTRRCGKRTVKATLGTLFFSKRFLFFQKKLVHVFLGK